MIKHYCGNWTCDFCGAKTCKDCGGVMDIEGQCACEKCNAKEKLIPAEVKK